MEVMKKLNNLYHQKSSRLLVMTRASQTLFILKDGILKEFDVLPIPKQDIVDTDGAGDAFVAGFLAQFVKNEDISECVRCALWTAKEIIQQHGCKFDKNKLYAA